MPVIRTKSSDESSLKEDVLRRELARELGREFEAHAEEGEDVLRQPIIFENEIGDQGIHVTVVWERWRLVPESRRHQIIRDAYESALPDRADHLLTARGLTTDEASSMGLLPWRIEYISNSWLDRKEEIMRLHGAVETPHGLVMRYPDRHSADVVVRRLEHATGAAGCWRVLEDSEPTPPPPPTPMVV